MGPGTNSDYRMVMHEMILTIPCCKEKLVNLITISLTNSHVTQKLITKDLKISDLCDTIDGSPPGSAIPGILQARTLEWVAISFSSA